MRATATMIGLLALSLPSLALAGAPVPMPGGGVAGPAALLAGIAVVAGVKYLRNKRK